MKNVVVPSSSTSTTFTTSTYTISELGSDEETAGLPHQSTTTVLSTTASVSEEVRNAEPYMHVPLVPVT